MCNATAGQVRIDFRRRAILLGAGAGSLTETIIISSGVRGAGIVLHFREFS